MEEETKSASPRPQRRFSHEEFTGEDAENFVIEEVLEVCNYMLVSRLPKAIYHIIGLLKEKRKTEEEINAFLKEIISSKETDEWIIEARKKVPATNYSHEYLRKMTLEEGKFLLLKFEIWGMCNVDKQVLDVLCMTRNSSLTKTVDNLESSEHVFNTKMKEKIRKISIESIKYAIEEDDDDEYVKYLTPLYETLYCPQLSIHFLQTHQQHSFQPKQHLFYYSSELF